VLFALMENSHLLVRINAQMTAIQDVINVLEIRTHVLNALPATICQDPHVPLVDLVNILLLSQLPEDHVSIVRKPTVKLVLPLTPPRPVLSVWIRSISLTVPARLVPIVNV